MKGSSLFNTRLGILLLIMVGLLWYAHVFGQTGYKDLDKLLEGKRAVAVGICPLADKYTLAKPDEAFTTVVECVVGRDPADQTKNYVALKDEKGVYALIVTNPDMTQELLWKRPLISA